MALGAVKGNNGNSGLRLHVVVEPDETGTYVARVLEFPGCVTQGKTQEDALDAIVDALDVYLTALIERAKPKLLEQSLRTEPGDPDRRREFELAIG